MRTLHYSRRRTSEGCLSDSIMTGFIVVAVQHIVRCPSAADDSTTCLCLFRGSMVQRVHSRIAFWLCACIDFEGRVSRSANAMRCSIPSICIDGCDCAVVIARRAEPAKARCRAFLDNGWWQTWATHGQSSARSLFCAGCSLFASFLPSNLHPPLSLSTSPLC